MDQFSKILTAVLAIGLAMYYYKQYKNWTDAEAKLTWPRNIQKCPDYWISTGNNKCKNVFNIGHCPRGKNGMATPQGEKSFNSSVYKGTNGDYNKCRWSKGCGSSWEGIDKLCA